MTGPRTPGSPEIEIAPVRMEDGADTSAMASRPEAEADREVASGTITLRWGKGQIGVVKRAAAILGVPYQTYLKQVVFRQAIADIRQAEAVLRDGAADRWERQVT